MDSASSKTLLIFDLDGTLIDSRLDLAHSVNAARAHMGLLPLEHETIYRYVGNGAAVLIERALGNKATPDNVETALTFFLQYYSDHKLDYTVLYPGVRDALDELLAASVPMAVLTNKPVTISQAIVEELGLGNHFFRVYGGNSFNSKKPHPIGIETLMAEAGTTADATIMVGDSGVDVQTARNAGVRCCGVTYGFQPETFQQHPPDFLVDRMHELMAHALSGKNLLADCIFCRIVAGTIPTDIIAQTDQTLTFLDVSPLYPGHLLIIPRVHFQTISDLPDDLLAPFFSEVRRGSRAVETGLGSEGSFVAINNKVSQTVPHLHAHVIPRTKGDGMKGFFWPRRDYKDATHREEIVAKLREAYRSL